MAKDKDLERSLDKAGAPRREDTAASPPSLAARLSPTAHHKASAHTVADTFTHDTAFHMAFLGSGQGGGRIADSFWKLGYRRVGIFNTTDSDFQGLDEEIPKLSLDIGGAAKDMRLARQALDGRDEEVWDLMQRAWGSTVDCVLVCAGLGGGTGSGTVLPLMHLARRYLEANDRPLRVGGVVSLPDPNDGQIICRNAITAFQELLQAKVSPLIVIDNARVQELYRPVMSQLLPKSNELVSQLFHLFNTLGATRSPHITFDRSELGQLLDGGLVVMGAADVSDVKTPADVSEHIKTDLANSVLAEVDLRRGRKAACLFVGNPTVLDTLSRDYFNAGFTMLDRIVGSAHTDRETNPVVVHRGLYPGMDPGLQCYTMVSELEPPRAKLDRLAVVAGLPASGGPSQVGKHLRVE